MVYTFQCRIPVRIEVQKGSAFLGGGWDLVSFVWITAYSIFWYLGILCMEEAEEEEGACQLWLLRLSPLSCSWTTGLSLSILTLSWVSGSALTLL